MDKRGELTSAQLAVIITAVVGFAILLFAIYKVFDNDSLTNRDLCRLSILSRASLPSSTGQAVPLNCNTEKICITEKEGFVKKTFENLFSPAAVIGASEKSECKQFAGEENVRVVKVDVDGSFGESENAKKIIEREYANAMFDCWAMTGQGKLDVFKGDGKVITNVLTDFLGVGELIREVKPQCIVCSRIAISDSVYEKDTKYDVLGRLDFNSYLKNERVPGSSLTYLQTFTDESVNSFAGIDKKDSDNKLFNLSVSTKQIAIIFMQINTKQDPEEIAANAAILAGTAIGGGGIISGVGVKLVKSVPGFSTLAALGAVGGAYLYAKDVQEDNQAISFASCGNYDSSDKSKLGCSLIKPINWDSKSVNGLCAGGIEGNL